MADSHGSNQLGKTLLVEDVADHAVGLALEEASTGTAGDNAAGILAAKRATSNETGSAFFASRILPTVMASRGRPVTSLLTRGAGGAEVLRRVLRRYESPGTRGASQLHHLHVRKSAVSRCSSQVGNWRYASRAPADDRVGADGSETHTCWAGAWALGLKGQRRDSSLPRERDFAVGRRERGTTLKRQDPLFFSSSLAQEKESAPIFHHLPPSRSGCPSSTNPQSPMNVAPGRLLALARLRSTVFGTTWNPESLRTGSKVLKARLRGPSMLRYYGERFSGFAGLNRAIPDLELKDVAEETR